MAPFPFAGPGSNDRLVDHVRRQAEFFLDAGPRDPRVLDALRRVDRAMFLPPDRRDEAYEDRPVDIGWGQTCSQPSLVAFMLDKLELAPGNSVLEVGAGCGYAAALAADLCSPGTVIAAEIIPGLASLAKANGAGWPNLEVRLTDGSSGLADAGPFDRIFLSAGVHSETFREAPLLNCLAPGGILLYPEAFGRLWRVRQSVGGLSRENWGEVVFVPLKGQNA